MGLDMYLSKKTYVKNSDYMSPMDRHEISIKKGGKVRTDIKCERISYIVEEVAYWRKFNALHGWFVENVQDQVDDCKSYYVERKKLEELLKVLEEVIQKRNKLEDNEIVAKKLLPTTQGFFFGSDDYDEYYYKDVEYTIEVIKECLENKDGEYYYESSW